MAVKPTKHQRRILREVIVPYALLGLSLFILASIRAVSTPADITLNVSEVSYIYMGSPAGSVLDARPYDDIYIANVTSATITPQMVSSQRPTTVSPNAKVTSISLEHAQLGQLYIPNGARVSINWAAPLLRISISGPATVLLNVGTGAPFSCDYCTASVAPLRHEFYRTAISAGTVSINTTDPVITLTVKANSPILASNMSIIAPSFLAGSAEWPVSSITGSGKLLFPDIDAAIDVREGDFVDIRKSDRIKVISLIPSSKGLQLHLSGQVSDIRLGGSRNRLPSVLERLWRSQPLALYCTAFGVIAGVIIKFLAQIRRI